METKQLIKSLRIFERLTSNESEKIAALCDYRTCAEGEAIFEEDSPAYGMVIILRGEVSIRKGAIEVAVGKKGDLFGEMSFLTEENASADVIAKSEEVDYFYIGHNELRDVLKRDDKMAVKIYRRLAIILAERLAEATEKLRQPRLVSQSRSA